MAKSSPKASSGPNPVDDGVGASRTPAGVWVIVGMAVLFVLGGLGTSVFVIWKSIGVKHSVPGSSAADDKVKPAPSAPLLSDAEVGVEHPSTNPIVEDAGPAPPVVNDRTEEDRTRQEVLKRIDLMRALTDADKDKLYAQSSAPEASQKSQ